MNEEIVKLQEELLAKFNENIKEQTKDFLNEEQLTMVKGDFEAQIKTMNEEQLTKFNEIVESLKEDAITTKEAHTELKDILKEQAREIEGLKSNKETVLTQMSRKEVLGSLIKQSFYSDEFKDFQSKNFKGASNSMTLNEKAELVDHATKAVIPISNHTGTVMISEISDVVRDDVPARKSHIRDILSVTPTNQAQIVAGQVYDFTDSLTMGAVMLSENEETPESVFKSKENTWTQKRIGNSFRISKNWFDVNGVDWVVDHILAKIPDAMFTQEDFQLLFGDGVSKNVKGLTQDAQSVLLEDYVSIAATGVSSVATYSAGAQALITFAAEHGIRNGDDVTFASATEATYNAEHKAVEVVNAFQIVIDLTYVAEAVTTAWTTTVDSIFADSIDNAQEVDCLMVTQALLEAGEFGATAHVVNPQQRVQMGLLKDLNANYLNIEKDSMGKVIGVGGLPLVATTAMPTGKYLTGDFSRSAVELRELKSFSIQFAEDVETAKKDEIVLIVQEKIIFPIYNPYWFMYGKFATVKAQIEKP